MSAAKQLKIAVTKQRGPVRDGVAVLRARAHGSWWALRSMWQRYTLHWVEWEERLTGCEGFQWDAGNTVKIWDRHQVTPAECEELFFNRPLVVGSDEKHSAGEGRLYALGQSDSGRLMFVVFTIRGELIRVISARNMSRKERGIYRST